LTAAGSTIDRIDPFNPGIVFAAREISHPGITPMIETGDSVIAPTQECSLRPMITSTGPPFPDDDGAPEIVIRPRSGWIEIDWKELFAYRELLGFLIWRDISVRYKQTILGPAWAVLQPLTLMLLFTIVFGRFAKINTRPFDYPVFVFAGLIPWTLFSQGMPQAALSLVNQQHLLTKVYFPRLFVPVAAASVYVVDLVISLGIYAVLLLYYRTMPCWTIVFLPLLIVLTLIATLSIGVTISALTVFYRDFKHIVPFLVQIFMYVTPVIYPIEYVGPRARLILALNPMFGIINGYRAAILGLDWHFPVLAISTASALILFVFAIFYFRRTERRFADFA
jgi:lipopolysaccharide transport system permease protein